MIGRSSMDRLETVDQVVEKYCVSSSPLKSKLYIGTGSLFILFAIIGIWVPGWPTVSWAVPAAFLFSLSSEKLFRKTLTNPYFGNAIFDYYATGKTIPKHAKYSLLFKGLLETQYFSTTWSTVSNLSIELRPIIMT